jgi:PAS domain S-box-containing protein
MDIAADGAILSTCTRFAALLKKRDITDFLGSPFSVIFSRLGKIDPPASPDLFRHGLAKTIDLSIQWPGAKSFVIRWIPTPRYAMEANSGGWQLTGTKVYPGPFPSVTAPISGLPEHNAGASDIGRSLERPLTAIPMRQVSDILIATDLEDRIVYWNEIAEKFYGIPSHIALGQTHRQLIRIQYVSTTERDVYQTLCATGYWEGETTYVSGDGKKSYLISVINYVRDTNRRLTGIMILHKDITEAKEAALEKEKIEWQLQQYSQQISGILESITDGFFVIDQQFKVQLWNHEAERITRIPAIDIVGKSIWEKLPEWADTDIGQAFHKAFKKKMTVTLEQYHERSDHWLEMSLYPSDQGMFAYFRDVTFRKKQEALLALEKKVLEMNTGQRMLLKPLLNFFLKGIQKIFPGMYCMVLTLDEDGRSVRLLSAPGLPAIYAHAIDGLPIGPNAGSCGTAMYRKQTVIVSDIATDPLWAGHSDLALQFGLRACWSIPVMDDRDEVLATFSVYYTTVKAPTNAEMDIFERVANLVTIIIESKKTEEKLLQLELNKQKLLAQAMIDAQEKERAEIGKELHDNINQILSTTKLYLELAKSDDKQRLSLINRSAGNIHHAIREIRNISRSLVPASIGDLGLMDSLVDLVESVQVTRTIQVNFRPIGNFERLSDKTKLMIFRIIQEQINNVLRHSGASNLLIELTLEETTGRIELNMTDDGKGFNPEKVRKKGLGLSNIRSRADLFGGKVTIQSAPGRGCKLRVQVPDCLVDS